MYALLCHKTIHKVSTLLHKQQWIQLGKTFHSKLLKLYGTLDARRKMAYSFQAKIAACRNHVYKNLAWSNAKQVDFIIVEIETDKESKKEIHIAVLLKLLLTYHHDQQVRNAGARCTGSRFQVHRFQVPGSRC